MQENNTTWMKILIISPAPHTLVDVSIRWIMQGNECALSVPMSLQSPQGGAL
jgi:hypothetical protein